MSLTDDKREKFTEESVEEKEFAENFLNSVQEMYASDNPNPIRAGCISSEAIIKKANSGKLPDDSAMNHFFQCSECFREFRQALEMAKLSVKTEKKSIAQSVFTFRAFKLAFAGAGFVLLIGLTLFSIWIFREKPSNELVKNIEISNEQSVLEIPEKEIQSNQNRAVPNTAPLNTRNQSNESQFNRPNKNFPAITRQGTGNIKTSVNKTKPLNLVLSGDRILRNAENSNASRELVLPARQVNLNIKLPAGYPDGRYKFRLTDAFEKTLSEQNAIVKNKKLLIRNLNLQNFEKRANKLCLQKGDEIPDCFDIRISRSKYMEFR